MLQTDFHLSLFESYNCRRWWKPGAIAIAIREIVQHYLGLLHATLYWCGCISDPFRWRLATHAIPTITSRPMQRWKSCTKITGKLWGFSFPSTPTNLPVGGNQKSQRKGPTRGKRWNSFHRDFIIIWQVLQTLAMYLSKSPASILSSTSAQMR